MINSSDGKKLRSCTRHRTGVTLFEILLATVILSTSLAAISQLAKTGVDAGLRTQLESEAMMHCQNKLDEMLSGLEPLKSVASQPLQHDRTWIWSASVEMVNRNLTRVTVRVETNDARLPASCELVQLVRSHRGGLQ